MTAHTAHSPLRVSVVGIDGAGKSSTTLRAIDLLSKDTVVCKPGRDAFIQRGSAREYCAKRVSDAFEAIFRRVDATRRGVMIGASRLAFIAYQSWLEPHMIRQFRPSLVISTRCMILDPAIYSGIYSPVIGRLSVESRLRAFLALSRLPFRDLYILLRTPAEVAMQRIFGRIARTPGYENQPREYWLHLHEQEPILRRIGAAFEEALAIASKLHPFEVVEIDTANRGEEQVSQIIAAEVRRRTPRQAESAVALCG